MSYDADKNQLKYVVNLENDSYVSLGFGTSMGTKKSPVDMVLFQANGKHSKCSTLVSTGHQTPTTAKINNYDYTYTQIKSNNTVTFTAYRDLAPDNS